MQKLILVTLSMLGFMPLLNADVVIPPTTTTPPTIIKEKPEQKQDLSAFYKDLQNQVKIQEQRVKKLYEKATSQANVPMWADKLALQNAIQVLEVKETLYGNFVNTPSVENALIRDYLLKLFTKPDITEGDLAKLQAMVSENRANTNASK